MTGSCHLPWLELKSHFIEANQMIGSGHLPWPGLKGHFIGTNQMTGSCHLLWLGLNKRVKDICETHTSDQIQLRGVVKLTKSAHVSMSFVHN